MAEPQPWMIYQSTRLPNGHLEVTYSLAPGVRFTSYVIPGTDAAAAIKLTGDILAQTYAEQGFI